MFSKLKSRILLIAKKDHSRLINPTIICFLSLLGVSFLTIILSFFIGVDDTSGVRDTVETIQSIGLSAIPILSLSVLFEEILFRGVILRFLGFFPSIILFGLAHFSYGSLFQIFASLLAGYVLAKTCMRSKSLVPGIIAHLAFNLASVFILNA